MGRVLLSVRVKAGGGGGGVVLSVRVKAGGGGGGVVLSVRVKAGGGGGESAVECTCENLLTDSMFVP